MSDLMLTSSSVSTTVATHMRDRDDEVKLLAVTCALPGHKWSLVRELSGMSPRRAALARKRLIAAGKIAPSL